MTNADKFKGIFGMYATELWAMPEKEFLEWLNDDVPDTNDGETISRQAAIDAVAEGLKRTFVEYRDVAEKIVNKVPSAHRATGEWCTDCKEYDTERHCCPRFNRVIRDALKDAQPDMLGDGTLIVTVPHGTEVGRVLVQEEGTHNGALYYTDPQPEQRWIPCEERSPKIDMSYPHHDDYLVQYDSGNMDVASWSNVNRFWTDHVTEPYWNCVQFAKVVAWMPLPKPWKGEDDETD